MKPIYTTAAVTTESMKHLEQSSGVGVATYVPAVVVAVIIIFFITILVIGALVWSRRGTTLEPSSTSTGPQNDAHDW